MVIPPDCRRHAQADVCLAVPRAATYTVGQLHPWSALGGSNLMHDDTSNTDATFSTGPSHGTVVEHRVKRLGTFFAGMVPTMAYVAVRNKHYLVGLSFGTETCPNPLKLRTTLYAWDEEGNVVSTYDEVPPPPPLDLFRVLTLEGRADLFRSTAGGAYMCVLRRADGSDDVDVMIPAINDRLVFVKFDGSSFTDVRDVYLDGSHPRVSPPVEVLGPKDDIVAALPEWTDCLPQAPNRVTTADSIPHWWVSRQGVVGIADPSDPGRRIFNLNDPANNPGTRGDESVNNSFALGKKGMFILSDRAMYRFIYKGGVVRRVWRHEYASPDLGGRSKESRLNPRGSGTTPTLLGEDYVAFADGAEKMAVVVLRQGTPNEELTDECAEDAVAAEPYPVLGLLAGEGTAESGCENSFVGFHRTDEVGRSSWTLLVGNTWGYLTPFSPILRRCEGVQGLECLRILDGDAVKCERVWSIPINIGSAVPKLSLKDQILYFYSFDVEDRESSCFLPCESSCFLCCKPCCCNRRTHWSLVGIHPELVQGEDEPRREFRYEVGRTRWFNSKKPGDSSREFENAWGTMVLTNGGAAIAWWRGFRWIHDA